MTKKEKGIQIGPVGGKSATEYTEKYEVLEKGYKAAFEILEIGEECTPERIAKIQAAKHFAVDASPSEVQKQSMTILDKAVKNV